MTNRFRVSRATSWRDLLVSRARAGSAVLLTAAMLVTAACDGNVADPNAASRMESVSGDLQPGLAGLPLDERLVVRVLDDQNLPVPNARVSWVVTKGAGSVTPIESRADDNGIARTTWTLGITGGEQEATANIGGVEPIVFTATASILGPTCGGAPLSMEVGSSVMLVGTQATELCIQNSTLFTRDYVLVGFNTSRAQSGNVVVSVQGTGIVSTVGPPSPDQAGSVSSLFRPEPRRDDGFDARLREIERMELGPRVIKGGAASARAAGAGARYSMSNPIIGEIYSLNTESNVACSAPKMRDGRVVAISQHAVIVEDVNNPPGGFTTQEYQSIGATFDTLVYPVDIEHFGEPSDIDGNGKVILFYTGEVNRLTARGSPNGFIAGYFFARDLFPRTGNSRLSRCETSNESEIMYLMVPDPDGVINGNEREKNFVLRRTHATLSHEMEHLINSSRRLYVNTNSDYPERVWLDEGLAHSAEELVFYRASGLAPEQNITGPIIRAQQSRVDAFNNFQSENIARLQTFLLNTNNNWPFRTNSPDISSRGASAWFLRYLVDRLGVDQSSSWRSLVNSPDTGMRNLEQVIHADPMQWIRDWSVSLYVDDVVQGVLPRFNTTSWHLRSVFSSLVGSQSYSLQVVVLNNGVTRTSSLQSAGSTFFRFGIPPTGNARLALTTVGNAANLSLVLVRTR